MSNDNNMFGRNLAKSTKRRTTTKAGSKNPGAFASAGNTPITNLVPEVEAYYNSIGFNATTSDALLNKTNTKVAKPVYNNYKSDSTKPKVYAYYTDWSQYDRQRDLNTVDPKAFDKIVLGFFGIVGDDAYQTNPDATMPPGWQPPPAFAGLATAAQQLGRGPDEVCICDIWGDLQSETNNTVSGTNNRNVKFGEFEYLFKETNFGTSWDSTKGIFRGLHQLKQKAKAAGHNLEIAFSVGGWTLSGIFSKVVADPARRATFVNSIVDIFNRFPSLFDEVDIDWEYPGVGGEWYNYYDEENDGKNYELMIGELRSALDAKFGVGVKKISIASIAVPEKLEKSNIPGLFRAGLDGINIMTYDFFGTPWGEQLDHHTNLLKGPEDRWSTEAVVQYLIGLGIDRKKMNIGWAAYSRSAQQADITSYSPLVGTYRPKAGIHTSGTYESGTCEWHDIIYNYIDLLNQSGRNGYEVYTDAHSNADYLYSPTSEVFMSIDTPRSCYVKGRYAKENNLGGVFMWTADLEHGTLTNAVREGAGYEVTKTTIDMAPLYFCGGNITNSECTILTFGGNSEEPGFPEISVNPNPHTMDTNTSATFICTPGSGEASRDLKYSWNVPAGFRVIGTTNQSELVVEANYVNSDTNYTISVTATNTADKSITVTVPVAVKNSVPITPPIIVTISSSADSVKEGELITFTSNATPSGVQYRYTWSIPDAFERVTENGNTITLKARSVEADKSVLIVAHATNPNTGQLGDKMRNVMILKNVDTVPPAPWLTVTLSADLDAVKSGELVSFTAGVIPAGSQYQYRWNVPKEFTIVAQNGNTITLRANAVTENAVALVTVMATDPSTGASGTKMKNTTIIAPDQEPDPEPVPEPEMCLDPDHVNYPIWNAEMTYTAPGTGVSYKGVVWSNLYYINPGENPPDLYDGWRLWSSGPLSWNNIKAYNAGDVVNHKDSQYKAQYWAGNGEEPGSPSGVMWTRIGFAGCNPVSRKT
jgi:chitinase